MNPEYVPAVDVDVEGQVGTIKLLTREQWERKAGVDQSMRDGRTRWWEIHPDIATALEQLRDDERVRVIVITGAQDGLFMSVIGHPHDWVDGQPLPRSGWTADWLERAVLGTIRHTNLAIEMEKPIIARVNGDALGIGQSVMFSCDVIIAREDAVIADLHMGLEDWPGYTAPPGFTTPDGRVMALPPGDGGLVALAYMSPAVAKEYLLLGKPYRARELAQSGAINYAVEADRLDDLVNDIAGRFIRRPATSVALAKRAANRNLAHLANLSVDAGAGYQWAMMLANGRIAARVPGT